MEHIGNVLDSFFKDNEPLAEKIESGSLRSVFNEIVGDMIANHCEVGNINSGFLKIFVDNSVLAHELTLQRDTVIKKMNERLSFMKVKEILFQSR